MARPRYANEPKDPPPPKNTNMLLQSFVSKPSCNSMFLRRPVNLAVGIIPGEPSPGAWVVQGDIVEVREQRPPKRLLRWYYGKVELISSSSWFTIRLSNGKTSFIPKKSVRAYVPFEIDEKVEYSASGKFRQGKIVYVHEDGDHVDVVIAKDGLKIRNVYKSKIRRHNRDRIVTRRKTQYY